MIAARQIFLGRGGAKLPYDAEVEYLESTGTQWIDTGIVPDFNTECRFSFAELSYVADSLIAGARTGTSSNERYFAAGTDGNGSIRFVLRGSQLNMSITYSSTFHEVIFNEINTHSVIYDGNSLGSFSSGNNVVQQNSLYLFGVNGYGNNHYVSNSRITYFQIFQSGVIIRDFIPVRFTNDRGVSEGAMYDRVSGRLFRNQGMGAFLYGADKIPVETDRYVQDGLVAMWDGKENAGWGLHDATATVWTNLVTGGASENIGVRTWGDSWLETTGSLALNLADNESNSRTMEVVFSTTSSDVQIVFMSMNSRRAIGVTGTSIGIGPYSAIPFSFTSGLIWAVSSVYPNESYSPEAAYVNGSLNADRTSGNFTNPVLSSIRIGGLYSRPFSGKIYCARLYNRQLTAEEIAANYAVDKARFNLP